MTPSMAQSFLSHTAYIDADMDGCETMPFLQGTAVAYSARSPEKESRPNEDGALILALDQGRGVLAVADGMGGHPQGDLASQLALESIARSIGEAEEQGHDLHDAIMKGFDAANTNVLTHATGAGTTLVVVTIEDQTIRTYHAGDSIVMLFGQRGRLRLQTTPHSPVGFAVEAGLLDEREAMHHEARHIISNFVGTPQMKIDVGSPLTMKQRDTLFIASDGIFDNLLPDEIVENARRGSMDRCGVMLAATCRERMMNPIEGRPSKFDDVTFLMYRPVQ